MEFRKEITHTQRLTPPLLNKQVSGCGCYMKITFMCIYAHLYLSACECILINSICLHIRVCKYVVCLRLFAGTFVNARELLRT